MTHKFFKEFITEFLSCFEVNFQDKKLEIEIED